MTTCLGHVRVLNPRLFVRLRLCNISHFGRERLKGQRLTFALLARSVKEMMRRRRVRRSLLALLIRTWVRARPRCSTQTRDSRRALGQWADHRSFSICRLLRVARSVRVPPVFPSPEWPPTAGYYCLINGRLGRRSPDKSIKPPLAVPERWRGRRILSPGREHPSGHPFKTLSEGVCAEAARRVRC